MDHNDHVRRPPGWIFGTDNIRRLPGPMVAHVQQPPHLFGRFSVVHVCRKHRNGDCWPLLRHFRGSKRIRHMLQLSHRVHELKPEIKIFSADPGVLRAGSPRQHNLVLPALRLVAGLLVLLHPAANIRDNRLPPADPRHPDVSGDAVLPRRGS